MKRERQHALDTNRRRVTIGNAGLRRSDPSGHHPVGLPRLVLEHGLDTTEEI